MDCSVWIDESHARDLESDLARYGLKTVKALENEATWYTMLVSGGNA